MATATATKTIRGSALAQEAKPEAVKVKAKLTSGIFKGKMVDLTMNSDGSVTHMSDPKITPEEREAWDWLMQLSSDAVESAQALREQNKRSRKITDDILNRLRSASE